MKLAFVFDVCFTKYNEHYYAINLSQQLWETRYLPVFDEIVVVGRYKNDKSNPKGKLVQSDGERVTFRCIQDCPRFERLLRIKKEERFIENSIKDCDAVICRSWWGVNTCKKLKKNYMIEVVSCAFDSYWNHSFLGRIVAIPAFFSMRKAVKNAPFVLYVTKRFLQKRYPTKGIGLGVSDVVLFETGNNEMMTMRTQKYNSFSEETTLILGTAGAVDVRYKGQENVIKALGELKKTGITKYIYQLAGGGDTTYLKRIVKQNNVEDLVFFKGPIPHDLMPNWYDSIDIYIQPSLVEGLPRAVIEAMSRGLPIIGTNSGGIPELIEKECIYNRKGLMQKEIARKLTSLDRNKLVHMSMRNYEFSKQFNVDTIVKKRIDFLNEFVKKTNTDSYENTI